ncbi:Vitamin K epoxide reductase family protein [Corynebacterium faecale]|nr:Vitamin K epoxide reductase family protein [Corynebacterium faecale]
MSTPVSTPVSAPVSTDTQTRLPSPPAWLGWVLLIGGLIGLACSVIIMSEKLILLENPDYVTSCDLNEVVSCGSVMKSGQAAAFGIPNPLFGIAGFAAVAAIGAGILAGARFRGWFWFIAEIGLLLATIFVHWLAYQSMFVIRALCPYCMVVWAVTIIMFVTVTAWNVKTYSGYDNGIVRGLYKSQIVIALVWLLIIAATAAWQFRFYF